MFRSAVLLIVARTTSSHSLRSSFARVPTTSTRAFSRQAAFSTHPILRRHTHHHEFPEETKRHCPSCSTLLPTPLPVCPNCKHIEPLPSDMGYHEMFGFTYEPNPFDIDISALRPRFRKAITVVHPDRWAGRDEGKEQLIRSLSTTLNNANRTLADPLQRALYILKREGVITDGENIVDDPELIMDVMESREAIENAETQEEVNQIRKENQEKVEESVHEISKLVAVKDWSGVLTAATKLKYLRGIDDAAREWPRSLHDH